MTSKITQIPLPDAFWFQEGPGVRKWQFQNSGIKLLNVGNITPDGRIDLEKTDRHLSVEEATGKYSHFLVDPGDLVIASSGISFDEDGFLRTKIAFVEDNHLPLCMNTSTIRFKPNKDGYSLNYLKHWFQSHEFRNQVSRLVTGSAQLNFGPSHLKSMMISIPHPEEQRRMAAILDKADTIRRKRAQALTLADDFLKSMYVFTVGHLNSSYEEWKPFSIEKLAEDKKGSIRSGPFGSALLHGEFVDQGIAVLGIDNAVQNKFEWGGRRFITKEKYESLQRYRVFPNDVIITIMGTTGRSAVVPKDIPEAITTKHLATITCNSELILPDVLSYAIHSDPMIIRQIKMFNKGAIMDGLNLGIIRKLLINLPPMEEQLRFVSILRKTRELVESINSSDLNGVDLFASLSQRAFRGEL